MSDNSANGEFGWKKNEFDPFICTAFSLNLPQYVPASVFKNKTSSEIAKTAFNLIKA